MAPFSLLVLLMAALLLIVVAEANSNNVIVLKQETAPQSHRNRKLGLINHHKPDSRTTIPAVSPSLSPSSSSQDPIITKEGAAAAAPGQSQHIHDVADPHHRQHSFDRSVAGGGVILGGLATTFFVAVICYIRATRRAVAEEDKESAAAEPAAADQRV